MFSVLNLLNQRKEGKSVNLPGHRAVFGADTPLLLECGQILSPFTLAYQTYGRLSAPKDNVILICHALTGDQFVAEDHPVTGKPGWWTSMVGPRKIIDTDKYFVICSNILGGCMGSTGPSSINPATDKPYGLDFPVITIPDMVRAQKMLIDHLGIQKLHAVIGGSMGGMQVLAWAALFPGNVKAAIPTATGARHSSQNIAFNEVGRQAVMADPAWDKGEYWQKGEQPKRGLSVARMAAHITYLSETALQRKFGRNLQNRNELTYGFDADFQVESYLRHQGASFVDRFDANSYLYITRAMDYFDLSSLKNGNLAAVFEKTPVRFCLTSFSSDWLFPTSETRSIVRALNAAGADVSFVEIQSDKGHDAFLLHEPEFFDVIARFLDGLEETKEAPATKASTRKDYHLIDRLIKPQDRVLDVGCGDGDLLLHLKHTKNITAAGLELSMLGVQTCVKNGLSVIQGDADLDLDYYHENAFDVAILSHTLQAMKNPRHVLEQLLRISNKAIISFPNFGHWKIRLDLGLRGRMPVNKNIPFEWWETPNIHFCTIKDFEALCRDMNLKIEKKFVLGGPGFWNNLLGTQAIYVLSNPSSGGE